MSSAATMLGSLFRLVVGLVLVVALSGCGDSSGSADEGAVGDASVEDEAAGTDDGDEPEDEDSSPESSDDDAGTDDSSADNDADADDEPATDDGGDDDVDTDDAPATDGDSTEEDGSDEDGSDSEEDPVEETSGGFVRDPALAAVLPTDVVAATGGAGVTHPLSFAPLPEGWTEEEFIFGGDATSYRSTSELVPEGNWDVEPADTGAYRTRMIVLRPPAEDFSGTVMVEWFNVTSGLDTSPDWAFTAEEFARAGHVYVGVSVQAVGVIGAGDGGSAISDLVETAGLPAADPERYGSLAHPGDAFAFDIMSQAGVLIRSGGADGADGPLDVLSGYEPEQVIAIGESQSAIFLTTYVNAIHPVVGVYDGFLLHSRGSGAPNPDGSREGSPEVALVRTDIDVPVFQFEAETDINRLGFFRARQPDSTNVHTWEVAGTAHADAYTLAVATGAERDPSLGSVLGCETVNDGPHHSTLQAALSHLVAWVSEGTTPPTSPVIEAELSADGSEIVIARDELGLALGGIRTPGVDAPRRVITGDPGEGGGFCGLFGQTLPIEADVLAERYESDEAYLEEMQASADNAVGQGWLLPEDAAILVAEETARAQG